MSDKPIEKREGEVPAEKKQPLTEAQAKKRKKTVIIAVIAVVLVLLAAVAVLCNFWFVKPELPPVVDGDPTPSVDPAESQDPDAEESQGIDAVKPLSSGKRKSKEFYTVLIFGQDVVSGLTDTIMVASYDVTNQRATIMSIPRDTIINTGGQSVAQKMINAVYTRNGKGEEGVKALKTEVSKLVGFVPDYYVMIDWELVGQMVDAIGGVYFDIPWHMGYDDPTQDLHIHFEEGNTYLNGEDAMNLVRWRENNDGVASPGSDLYRLNIHHDFLKAVLKQTLQPQNVFKIDKLVQLFGENVESDLSIQNMLWFGRAAVLGGLDVDDVEFVTMPCYGVNNRNARYWGRVFPKQDQLLELINESLNPYVEEVTIEQLDLIQPSADGNSIYSSTGVLAK